MKVYKEIAYAYPTSTNAAKLGFRKDGCFYVSIEYVNIEDSGQCKTFMPHDAEGFERADDPDLVALFHEYDGEIHPDFLKYGNPVAVKAVTA